MMRYSTFFQRTVLFVFMLLYAIPSGAQEYLYEIGGMVGSAFYMGDANKNTAFKNMNPAVSVVFRYNANFRVAIKGDPA